MKRSTYLVLLLSFLLSASANIVLIGADSHHLNRRVLRVKTTGEVFVSDKQVFANVGISPPKAFEEVQESAPDIYKEDPKAIWYSYARLGILAYLQPTDTNDFVSIILKAKPIDAPHVCFEGVLILGDIEIEFEPQHPLSRQKLVKLIKNIKGTKPIARGQDFSFYWDTTSIDVLFDAEDFLRNITVGIKAKGHSKE